MGSKGKVVASIEARVGSTRLPGKVLREIMGRPLLELMIERVKRARFIDEIIVAASVNSKDDDIEKLCAKLGIGCFRGSEDDVLERVLGAVKKYNGDYIVELWGDTPLIDPAIIDMAVEYYFRNNLDCAATCLDKTFPWGMSLLVFSAKVLAEVDLIAKDPVCRENVSNYIYEHPEKYKIGHLPCPEAIKRPELRLVVDELPDFELVTNIFENLGKTDLNFTALDIIRFLDSHPDLIGINKNVRQKKIR